MVAELKNGNTKLLIAVTYRRPTALSPYELFENLAVLTSRYRNIIITGDFNANLLTPSKPETSILIDLVKTHSFSIVSTEPTHHVISLNPPSHTTLDLFIVNHIENVIHFSKSVSPFIAGHDFIHLILNIDTPKAPPTTIVCRNLNNLNQNRLHELLSSNLSPENYAPETVTDINRYETSLSSAILNAFEQLAPLKSITIPSKHKPWVTPQIKRQMKIRDKAYKLASQSHLPELKKHFSQLRSLVSNALDTAKNNYLSNILVNSPSLSKRWRQLRSMGVSKKQPPSATSIFTLPTLNSHFSAVTNRHPPLTASDLNDILNSPRPHAANLNQFSFSPVTDKQVLSVIKTSYSSSCGPDQISTAMLKLCTPTILPHLTALINASFSSSQFPTSWKNSHIRALLKTISPTSPSDTRPIALLPEMAKIQERLAYDQLLFYLESNKLFTPRQACYRKGHSTQTALLGVLDDIRKAVEQRKVTLLTLFDFSKAFDCIPHKKLLAKLLKYNLSDTAITWLHSYLIDRHQTVIDDKGNKCSWYRVSAGVPQGSVLGPLLFALFINDLPDVLLHSNHMIYADDTQIYYHCFPSEILHGISVIQRDAQAVADWAEQNGLELNLKKSKVMLLGSEAYILSGPLNVNNLPCIHINDNPLQYVNLFKNLGLWITPTLDWKAYVELILKKVHSSLGSLHFYRKSLSFTLKKQLILSLVLPHFDYASIAFIDLDKTRISQLQVAHNSCIRFIFGYIPFIPTSSTFTHLTHKRLELGWLTLSSRRQLQLALFMYKTIAFHNPEYLAQGLTLRPLNRVVSRPPRLPPRAFDLPSARTESWKSSFSYAGRSLLNTLVVTSFNRERVLEFKNWLYALFLKHEVEQWRTEATLQRFTPLSSINQLPHPTLPLNESAFTFTNLFQNTTGYRLELPFIYIIPRHLQSHL